MKEIRDRMKMDAVSSICRDEGGIENNDKSSSSHLQQISSKFENELFEFRSDSMLSPRMSNSTLFHGC